MEVKEFIHEALGNTMGSLLQIAEGLAKDDLFWKPAPNANHAGFLLWHIGRAEDFLTNKLCRKEAELWERDPRYERFGADVQGWGYGFDAGAVNRVPVFEPSELLEYIQAVRACTLTYLHSLSPADLPIKPRPDGQGMSVGQVFRLLITHNNQHLAQIDYIEGLRQAGR